MHEVLTVPRPSNPIEVFRAVQGPTLASWVVHRSRQKRIMEVHQDLARSPWRGERQAQTDPPRTARMAAMLDKELAFVPPAVRRKLPKGGNYPVVAELESGTGPNPFLDPPDNPDAMDIDTVPLRGPPPADPFAVGSNVRPFPASGRRMPADRPEFHRDLGRTELPPSKLKPNFADRVDGPGIESFGELARHLWEPPEMQMYYDPMDVDTLPPSRTANVRAKAVAMDVDKPPKPPAKGSSKKAAKKAAQPVAMDVDTAPKPGKGKASSSKIPTPRGG